MRSRRAYIFTGFTAVILSVIFFCASGMAGSVTEDQVKPKESHDMAYARNLAIFNDITRQLEQYYVDSIRVDEAFKGAIGGMLNTVDPYTEYFSSDDSENLQKMTTGSYGGIGSFITTRSGWTYISEPIEGSPAQKAGLRPGDKILRVDSVELKGEPGEQVSKMLKGVPGTMVKVTVERPWMQDKDSILTFDILREKVTEPSVTYSGIINDGRTGYVRLSQFVEKSPEDVRKALEGFKADPDVKSVILDLRGNGGGLVNSAIEILGYFLPKGTEVLTTKGKDASSHKTYKTRRQPIFPDIPLAVLIDEGSASASEITAGAIQDLDRGVLVGERSYGKGLVQSTFALPYNTYLKVTTAKYYIPSGRLIQALDYSHRNPDGTVARTPDSLTNVYRTRAGREVRDGGGLTPDSVAKWPAPSSLLYELVTGNHIFDYATKYAAHHDSIAPAGEFRLTDADYEDLISGIDPSSFKYDKICNEMVKNLRDAVKDERFSSPEVTALLDSLERTFDRDLRSDMMAKREDIARYAESEIAGRYYGVAGRTQQTLVYDPIVAKAIEILNTPGLYEKILSRPAEAEKKNPASKGK